MNTALLLFNFFFYVVVLSLYGQAKKDPSSSLEAGFAFVFIFTLFPILQIILWRTKIIRVKSVTDKIAMVTTTPLLPIICFSIVASISRNKSRSSTYEFNVNSYRYQVVYYDYPDVMQNQRIEVYKSVDTISDAFPFPETDKWVKDSVWLYFSKAGDTIRKDYYKNDTLINSTSVNTGF